ncbi:J domain-containing protein [Caloramator proteoclasticus]|uniref:TPR repeat-containing protein n=1 Tax=Caloramator proteoclasticus DSM 10124 TaxID=1121262 RepID=A0A1M4Z1T3_9CLOT|nr:DnaJ domain-containing protein [Caloramator proteoclasticus]SHF12029.1 TPR repeat-containing protein [Caloramator proteoclasticus DSM 10124]
MQNYYEILQIKKGASSEEIKKAYARLLRKYHPERDEENFKRIREAYEILSNPEKRREYDFQLEYGDEFLETLQEVEELIELEEYEEAIGKLKRMTFIKPDDERIWVKLAEVYSKDGRIEEATEILQKALNYINNSALIYFMLGVCFEVTKNLERAEFYFKKALEIEKDFYIYEKLYFIYIFENKKIEANRILSDMSKLELNDFNLIDYRLLLIKHNAITQTSINECECRVGIYVKELIESAEEREETKAYLINQIINELKFYDETELIFGLYYCWKILYFITKDKGAKERYEFLKDILFKNSNKENKEYEKQNLNEKRDITPKETKSYVNNENKNVQSTSTTNSSIYTLNNDNKKIQNSSSDNVPWGWIILFLFLASIGPVGIILFFVILYFAKKD